MWHGPMLDKIFITWLFYTASCGMGLYWISFCGMGVILCHIMWHGPMFDKFLQHVVNFTPHDMVWAYVG